jgi:serine/threonine protein kinase
MAVASGTRIGPYEVVALLGAGGMGEVYRAHDTKLGREVAIILPHGATGTVESSARFEREARWLASVNTRTSRPSTAISSPPPYDSLPTAASRSSTLDWPR